MPPRSPRRQPVLPNPWPAEAASPSNTQHRGLKLRLGTEYRGVHGTGRPRMLRSKLRVAGLRSRPSRVDQVEATLGRGGTAAISPVQRPADRRIRHGVYGLPYRPAFDAAVAWFRAEADGLPVQLDLVWPAGRQEKHRSRLLLDRCSDRLQHGHGRKCWSWAARTTRRAPVPFRGPSAT
jgi:hypothetical protein